jgi:hypothetical protein
MVMEWRLSLASNIERKGLQFFIFNYKFHVWINRKWKENDKMTKICAAKSIFNKNCLREKPMATLSKKSIKN